mgnify:FL=1
MQESFSDSGSDMEYDQDDDDDETWMPTFEEIGALPCSSESSKLSNEM